MKKSNGETQSLSYEKAYAELETIVDELESDSKTLEEALALYERGQALAQHCALLLERAELRVTQLSGSSAPDELLEDPF